MRWTGLWRGRRAVVGSIGVLLLHTGCAPGPRVAPPSAATAVAPPAVASASVRRLAVVAGEMRVRAYRDGPLARLGHNHAIVSTALEGTVELAEPLAASRFALRLPVDSLQVDLPQERASAGADFSAPVPDADRAGTRRNMLGSSQLDAARFPVVTIESVTLTGGPVDWVARVRITLRGAPHLLDVPVRLTATPEEIRAEGGLSVDQAALGLEPFSVALGALRVRRDLDIDFRLRARPENPSPAGT